MGFVWQQRVFVVNEVSEIGTAGKVRLLMRLESGSSGSPHERW